MFDDLVLVLQERTSEYEDRHGQDKTKSEVCQEKKLHLYTELVFPISLYSSPYPCTFPIIPVLFPLYLYSSPCPCSLRSIYSIKMLSYQLLITIPPFSPYPCTLPHIPVPFPYFWTF